jgi:predicted NAD/FAD-dependent oxidoreductase
MASPFDVVSRKRRPFFHLDCIVLAVVAAASCSALSSVHKQPSVAVIGGGIAGLSCAQRLSADGSIRVTVFDTGRLRPGGRASSRYPGDRPKEAPADTYPLLSQFLYDHAAQIVTVPEQQPLFCEFKEQIKEWAAKGILQRYPEHSLYTIGKLQLTTIDTSSNHYYYPTRGMGSLAQTIATESRFELRSNVWVSPSHGVSWLPKTRQWQVQQQRKGMNGQQQQQRVLGRYDFLVIAHNGKCADRLMSQTPAKRLHNLLRVNFAPTVPATGGSRMTLNSLYSLTICVNKNDKNNLLARFLPETFVSGFVSDNNMDLRFLSCQTRKYRPSSSSNDDLQVWTIISSPSFAKRFKAPQEFLSNETIATVSSLLLEAIEECIRGLSSSSSDQERQRRPRLKECVLEQRLQLWGAALPINVWNGHQSSSSSLVDPTKLSAPTGFLFDGDHQVGACGDWLVEPSIAGAWTSGNRLANCISTVVSNQPPTVESSIPSSSYPADEHSSLMTTTGFEGSFVDPTKQVRWVLVSSDTAVVGTVKNP